MTEPTEDKVRGLAEALLVNVRAYVDGKIDHGCFVATANAIWKQIPRDLVQAVGAVVLDASGAS